MSLDILVKRALKRREIFRKLWDYLETVKGLFVSLIRKLKYFFSDPLQRADITTQAI